MINWSTIPERFRELAKSLRHDLTRHDTATTTYLDAAETICRCDFIALRLTTEQRLSFIGRSVRCSRCPCHKTAASDSLLPSRPTSNWQDTTTALAGRVSLCGAGGCLIRYLKFELLRSYRMPAPHGMRLLLQLRVSLRMRISLKARPKSSQSIKSLLKIVEGGLQKGALWRDVTTGGIAL